MMIGNYHVYKGEVLINTIIADEDFLTELIIRGDIDAYELVPEDPNNPRDARFD